MSAQNMRNSLITAALAALAAFAAVPALAQMFGPEVARYVDENATGTGDGQSWTNACTTLQKALDDATTNSSITVINVAEGTYYPDEGGSHVSSDESESFVIPDNGLTLFGGYPTGGGTRDPAANVTILSGDIDQNGFGSDNSYHVLRAYRLSQATILDGFTVTSGYADSTSLEKSGGGMLIYNCDDFTITNCVFSSNHAFSNAGGLYVLLSTDGTHEPSTSEITIEDSEFNGNNSGDEGGGFMFINSLAASGHDVTLDHTDFIGNEIPDDDGGDNTAENGAGMAIGGADVLKVTDCNFSGNEAFDYAGAVQLNAYSSSILLNEATFTRCTFDSNVATAHNGGAVYMTNSGDGANDKAITFDRCDFIDNESNGGGGAIWVLTTRDAEWDTILDLTDCKFIGNAMVGTDDGAAAGGGVWLSGNGGAAGPYASLIRGTWTNCDFIGNSAIRGGGAYFRSSDFIEILNCRFIGNTTEKAGGGLGIGDAHELGSTDTRICKSFFVSNTSKKGGAIHNHEGAVTYMVNCILAGNSSTEEGGAIFNSKHTGEAGPAELYVHNCIIAGNVADGTGSNDRGGGVFNGFEGNSEGDEAIMEMVHCTLVGNYAGASYGGAVNVVSNSTLRFYNSISRDNTDADGGTGDFAENLFHEAGYEDSPHDADNFVADGTLPSIYNPGSPPTWTASDPVFVEDGTTTLDWNSASYVDGVTTFEMDEDPGSAEVGMLFKPYPGDAFMLLIKEVDTGNDLLHCWGVLQGSYDPQTPISGALYDLHIDDTGSAWDFGDTGYVPLDYCDLNGENGATDKLPFDLDLETREVNDPDCGAYEIPAP